MERKNCLTACLLLLLLSHVCHWLTHIHTLSHTETDVGHPPVPALVAGVDVAAAPPSAAPAEASAAGAGVAKASAKPQERTETWRETDEDIWIKKRESKSQRKMRLLRKKNIRLKHLSCRSIFKLFSAFRNSSVQNCYVTSMTDR